MRRLGLALMMILVVAGPAAAAEHLPKLALALGDTSYLSEDVVAESGAALRTELGEFGLDEYSLLVLANVPLAAVPSGVREGLPDFLSKGGSLLLTGGPGAFGSGGYEAIAPFLPFGLRGGADWRANPFKPVLLLQPGHPIFAGVSLPTIGTFNDLNPRPGASELAQYQGGGTVSGSKFSSPLIAEAGFGPGSVVGVAFDLGAEIRGGWGAGSQFVRNLVKYLVDRSPLVPKPRKKP
ncbi:MAG: hypothetical protein L0214_06505 [candidate division NC10 bacterium]|nr:hypothetical protein [candidate division NC10 bacterium]